MYYKVFSNLLEQKVGNLMYCGGYQFNSGCGKFFGIPQGFGYDPMTAMNLGINPMMLLYYSPVIRARPQKSPAKPKPKPQSQPSKVVVKLTGGHCFEEEDDVYNDDLYILYAARDAFGNRYSGSSGIAEQIDEGDSFRFNPDKDIIYSGFPGEMLQFGFVAMESEDSHTSWRIQKYWKAAEFASEYIPKYGKIISYAIGKLNVAVEYFDFDDRLSTIELTLDASEMKKMIGYSQDYSWNFKGTNNMSDYRYRIDYVIEYYA